MLFVGILKITHSHTHSYVLKDQDKFFGCIYCRSQPYGRLPDTAIYINVLCSKLQAWRQHGDVIWVMYQNQQCLALT